MHIYIFYYLDADETRGFFQWWKFRIHLVSANRKRAWQHRARLAIFHKSFALKTKSVGRLVVEVESSNQVPNFELSFLDEEQNERIQD